MLCVETNSKICVINNFDNNFQQAQLLNKLIL